MFMNTSDIIGNLIMQGTNTTTGSLFVSLFVLLIFLIIMATGLGIDLEWIVVFLAPYLLACASYYGDWIAPLITALLYLAMVLTKRFMFQ